MAVFDTNIIIDYLNGHAPARTEFEAVRRPVVSIITWMEVLVGVPADARADVEAFLADRCDVVPIDQEIARHAVVFRADRRLKLLDAIVLATAFSRNQVLVTRDSGFKAGDPLVRIPYHI